MTAQGPKLIEYNVRFGDPECQVLMLRLMSDLVPALIASRDGQLKNFDLRWYDDAALVVVMATKGYPGNYGKGSVIARPRCGGARSRASRSSTPARRPRADRSPPMADACSVSAAPGKSVAEAQSRAYAAVDKIDWPERLLPAGYRISRDCAREAFRIAAAYPCHQVQAR